MNRIKSIYDCIKYKRLKSVAQRFTGSTARQEWQTFCCQITSNTRLSVNRLEHGQEDEWNPIQANGNIVKPQRT